MKRYIKMLSLLLVCVLLTACGTTATPVPAVTAEPAPTAEPLQDITVIYTNDVHCGISDALGYDGLAAYYKAVKAENPNTLLVDVGDFIQGDAIGTLTRGEALIKLMNAAGYDLAALGNHELDYGAERLFELTDMAEFPVVCCNFFEYGKEEPVYKPYEIFEVGGRTIAFVGVLTPETFIAEHIRFFDDDGNQRYDCMGSAAAQDFYDVIQKNVDNARAEGADTVILLAHLGIDAAAAPFTSTDVIENTNGIDAVLDGHSHSTVEMEKVRNKDGESVLLSQTGTKLNNIGRLFIPSVGEPYTKLISSDEWTEKDADMSAEISEVKEKFNELLGTHIMDIDFDLAAAEADNVTWLVRASETNLGDLVTDMLRTTMGTDIALIGGGNIRASIHAGEVTYASLLKVFPFGNVLASRTITGKQLADALEYSVASWPNNFGGFLQVSGITFDVNVNKTAKLIFNADGGCIGAEDGERRVSNIMVNGEPLSFEREYTVASNNYLLMSEGDGYAMFDGIAFESDIADIDAFVNFMLSFNGELPEEYRDAEGQGRINFINN